MVAFKKVFDTMNDGYCVIKIHSQLKIIKAQNPFEINLSIQY